MNNVAEELPDEYWFPHTDRSACGPASIQYLGVVESPSPTRPVPHSEWSLTTM